MKSNDRSLLASVFFIWGVEGAAPYKEKMDFSCMGEEMFGNTFCNETV